MEKKNYQVIKFDRSTNDFEVIKCTNDFVYAIENAMVGINKDIDAWNEVIGKRGNNARKCDYVEYDEMYEIFGNGRNYTINNHVYGIIDMANDEVEYEDVVVVIWDTELTENDIKAIKIPFDDKKFFDEYMKRVVIIMGGKYDVYSLDNFDSFINSDEFIQGFKERPYIVHTKIVK